MSDVIQLPRRRGKDAKKAAKAARQKRWRDKQKSAAAVDAAKTLPETPPETRRKTPRGTSPEASTPAVSAGRPAAATSWALTAVAYGFAATGIGINVWNAMVGTWAETALPAALGVLSELACFWIPARIPALGGLRKFMAIGLLCFMALFAAANSLRMASIVAADQATARADRQTGAVVTAGHDLEAARAARDAACRAGQSKSAACHDRQAEVTRLEASRASTVAAQARPESADFARLVSWVSRGTVQPSGDDFSLLMLMFRTCLPLAGGLVLMLARR